MESQGKGKRRELLLQMRFDEGRMAPGMLMAPVANILAADAELLLGFASGSRQKRTPHFPLRELPEELQLLVAAHVVSSPCDRVALCFAVPPLGRKATKEIPAYTGPLMSLGKRVLSGGAVSEAEVRRFVREFEPSEAAHPPLALNEYTQLNTMAAPSARVRCVTEGSNLEWRLESGALLRCWKVFTATAIAQNAGVPGMHHYEGAAGAERLVSLVFADGDVRDFRGERGAEALLQRRTATGYYRHYNTSGWWDLGFWRPSVCYWDLPGMRQVRELMMGLATG